MMISCEQKEKAVHHDAQLHQRDLWNVCFCILSMRTLITRFGISSVGLESHRCTA